MLKKVWKQKLLNSYVKFFLKEPKIDDNIFITSTDGIGDNIIRLNLLEEILNQYGNDKCYILCDIKVVPLLKTIGFKNIIVFTKRMRRYLFGKIKLLSSKTGTVVKKGQILAKVNTMGIDNEVKSTVNGILTEILVADGSAVDFAKELFKIEV